MNAFDLCSFPSFLSLIEPENKIAHSNNNKKNVINQFDMAAFSSFLLTELRSFLSFILSSAA